MRNGKIGVGIIGASPLGGWAGGTHVPAIKSVPDFELAAVSTSRKESADAAKKQWGVPFAFDNHADLIARPEVDLVVVSVRVPMHFELVSAALQAGKAVYCEWPLGNGLAEAIKLADLAHAKGVGNWIGLQLRASHTTSYVRDLIKQGYVGEVLSTSVIGSAVMWGQQVAQDYAYIFDRKNGITPLAISCAHRIDSVCYCLGEFKDVAATVINRVKTATVVETGEKIPKNVDDEIAFSGVLESGALASVHYHGGLKRGANLLWEINGTEGDLQIVDSVGSGQTPDLLGGRGADKTLAPLAVPETYFPRTLDAIKDDRFAYHVGQHYVRLASDMKAGTHLVPTFADAVVRHRLLDAIEKASSTGMKQSYAR